MAEASSLGALPVEEADVDLRSGTVVRDGTLLIHRTYGPLRFRFHPLRSEITDSIEDRTDRIIDQFA